MIAEDMPVYLGVALCIFLAGTLVVLGFLAAALWKASRD